MTTLPDSFIRVEKYAFENCSSITEFTLSNNVEYIGEAVFRGATSLETLTIPFVGEHLGASVEATIKERMFGWIFGYKEGAITDNSSYSIVDSLRNVHITDDINIAKYAFYNLAKVDYIA